MEIKLNNLSKRFDSGWVFRKLDFHIENADKVAIEGPNGSGKSTLIAILCGYLSPSEGDLVFRHDGTEIDRDELYKYLSISTAYTELDEELNPAELYRHYSRFKRFFTASAEDFLEEAQLDDDKDKAIKHFSSGMKQRLSLALAICADVPLLVLDEPSSFLDEYRKNWLERLLEKYAGNKTVLMASNESSDLRWCTKSIKLKAS